MRHFPAVLALLCGASSTLLAVDSTRTVDLADLDSAPERLEAPPVVITPEIRRAGVDATVTMTAVVAPDGKVARIEDVNSTDAAAAKAATQAVKGWVFSRAYSGGQPVGYRLPVAIAVRPGQTSDDSADTGEVIGAWGGEALNVAAPAYESIPEYPEALRAHPVDGYAMVSLLVDEKGRPSDAVVEFATRREFAAPAASVVLDWVFAPTIRRGGPVASRTLVSVLFPAKSAAWDTAMRTRQAQLQYARSYDEAPQEKSSCLVVFPYEALISGKRGIATLGVVVSPEGQVVQVSPGPGAEPDFVAASRASLANWQFFPAMKAGRPVYGLIAINMNFDPAREEFAFDETSHALIAGLADGTATVFSLKQVDTLPAPTKQVAPKLPADHEGAADGEAVIEVIIDVNGRPQLPRIVRATTPGLGWAAATAVAQWKFAPARKAGEPVICRARLPVKFTAAQAPAAP